MMEMVTSRYLAAGGNVFDDYLHPTLNNDIMVKYLGDIQDEYKNGYTPPGSLDFELGEAAASFQQGNTAMCWNWLITVAWVEDPKQSKAAGKSGYFLPPLSTTDGKMTPGGITRLASFGQAIASTSKNKEAAYLLAQWIADKDTQSRITEAGDSAPSRYSILWGPLKDKYPHFWLMRTARRPGLPVELPQDPERGPVGRHRRRRVPDVHDRRADPGRRSEERRGQGVQDDGRLRVLQGRQEVPGRDDRQRAAVAVPGFQVRAVDLPEVVS